MAFKGTTTRIARQIAEEIEAVGGDLNAATTTETTAYYARVLKADVPLALDVLSDILANPSFEADELEREKSVIEQEIGAAQDTPDDVIFEHMQRTGVSRTADGPLAARHAGNADDVHPRDACTAISPSITARPTWWSPPPARSITSMVVTEASRSALRNSPARRRRHRRRRSSAAARAWFIAISNRRT